MRTSGFVQSNGEPLDKMRMSAPRLGQAFDDVWVPDVLANRHADAYTTDFDRVRQRPRIKDPLLIEHAVVRQLDLEAHGADLAPLKQDDRVVDLAVFGPDRAHQNSRPRSTSSAASASTLRPEAASWNAGLRTRSSGG